MTSYVKLYPAQISDGRWAGANKAAFSVHMAAISYCDEQNADQKTDGRISRHDALRLKAPCVSPDEVPLAIKSLLQRGFWQQDGRGQYQIVQYLAHARSAEQILTDRAHNAADKARRSQHAAGDHSLCVDPRHCPAVREAHAAGDHSLCKDRRFCKYLPKASQTTPVARKVPLAKAAPETKAPPKNQSIDESIDWYRDEAEWSNDQKRIFDAVSERMNELLENSWLPNTEWANVDLDDDKNWKGLVYRWQTADDGYPAFRAKEVQGGASQGLLDAMDRAFADFNQFFWSEDRKEEWDAVEERMRDHLDAWRSKTEWADADLDDDPHDLWGSVLEAWKAADAGYPDFRDEEIQRGAAQWAIREMNDAWGWTAKGSG
jgi:hypothetical protein